MTKKEWKGSTDIWEMLSFANLSDRKIRLFGCGCCRHMQIHLMVDEKVALNAAELYADGKIKLEEMLHWKECIRENGGISSAIFYSCYDLTIFPFLGLDGIHFVGNALLCILDFLEMTYIGNFTDRRQLEVEWQANLLRHMIKYEGINHARN